MRSKGTAAQQPNLQPQSLPIPLMACMSSKTLEATKSIPCLIHVICQFFKEITAMASIKISKTSTDKNMDL